MIFPIARFLMAELKKRNLGSFGEYSKWYGGEIHAPRRLEIGKYVYIGPGFTAHAFGGIVIGDGTVIGPNLTIHTRNHRFEDAEYIPYDGEYILKGVEIGKGTWIGDSVILLPGANIGNGAVIGAGAVVSGRIPEYSVIAGNPAKVIRDRRDVERATRLIMEEAYYMRSKRK